MVSNQPSQQRPNARRRSSHHYAPHLLEFSPSVTRQSLYASTKKSMWPEVVGMTGVEARKVIKESGVQQVQIVEPHETITEDYLPLRVQIFVDPDGVVVWPPQIG